MGSLWRALAIAVRVVVVVAFMVGLSVITPISAGDPVKGGFSSPAELRLAGSSLTRAC